MLKIIVPMAGKGKRFVESGYSFPKPLIEINGQPMIELIIRNLTPDEPHQFIFVCQQEHVLRFSLKEVLKLVAPGCQIITMHEATAGALCSVLLATEFLNDESELLIANADQLVDEGVNDFLSKSRAGNADGCIMTFPSTHPKWSFVKMVGEEVLTVAEKRPISNNATVGIYYFKKSSEFLAAAERMLLKNASVGGEFYVSPVFNELILMGKRIYTHRVSREMMHSLGTPEDVKVFTDSLLKSHVYYDRNISTC